MAKILLVEDDAVLAEHVKDSLASFGHLVDHVANGDEGLYWLTYESFSIAIIDWNLPGMPGPDICSQYRKKGGRTPILMLTGMSSENNMVHGLDSGADDYLPKPFEMQVLRARLRSLLRRHTAAQCDSLTIGEIELDRLTSEVLVNGEPVKMTRTEFTILELLLNNAGKFVSSEAVAKHVWPSDANAAASVRSHVARLKKRLDVASPAAASMLSSSYGKGYKIEQPSD